MKTTGAVVLSCIACFMHTENTNDPAGDTQTFEPRPRPANWVVAVNVKPVGRFESSFAFLQIISKDRPIGRGNLLFQHRIGAGDNLAVHEVLPKLSCLTRSLLLIR